MKYSFQIGEEVRFRAVGHINNSTALPEGERVSEFDVFQVVSVRQAEGECSSGVLVGIKRPGDTKLFGLGGSWDSGWFEPATMEKEVTRGRAKRARHGKPGSI